MASLWCHCAAFPEPVLFRLMYFCPLIQTASNIQCKPNAKVVASSVTPSHFLLPITLLWSPQLGCLLQTTQPRSFKIHFYIYCTKNTNLYYKYWHAVGKTVSTRLLCDFDYMLATHFEWVLQGVDQKAANAKSETSRCSCYTFHILTANKGLHSEGVKQQTNNNYIKRIRHINDCRQNRASQTCREFSIT